MDQARAFALAGNTKKMAEVVTGHAHAAVNCMADGPVKRAAKELIGNCREVADHYQALVFSVYPAAMTYHPDMTEAELRDWAFSMVEVIRGAP